MVRRCSICRNTGHDRRKCPQAQVQGTSPTTTSTTVAPTAAPAAPAPATPAAPVTTTSTIQPLISQRAARAAAREITRDSYFSVPQVHLAATSTATSITTSRTNTTTTLPRSSTTSTFLQHVPNNFPNSVSNRIPNGVPSTIPGAWNTIPGIPGAIPGVPSGSNVPFIPPPPPIRRRHRHRNSYLPSRPEPSKDSEYLVDASEDEVNYITFKFNQDNFGDTYEITRVQKVVNAPLWEEYMEQKQLLSAR